jgi:hypothetical protein
MAIDLTKAARVVPSEHGDVFTQSQWQSFDDKVAELNGAPGAPLKPKGLDGIEKVAGIRRVSYQHGVIYEHPDGKCVWVYGAINDRYNELGGPTSWLGLPLADEAQFDNEKGRVSLFERGSIYWWPDVGSVDLNDVIVHYTGLNCFGETSDGPFSSADEPYVILGAVAPS